MSLLAHKIGMSQKKAFFLMKEEKLLDVVGTETTTRFPFLSKNPGPSAVGGSEATAAAAKEAGRAATGGAGGDGGGGGGGGSGGGGGHGDGGWAAG